ncbi:SH3 domain [Nakaseomyces glabratus]|nr:SH3 domain [Nakaseomyces glabratus]KAH7593237.1 SH3 domain [Nakaseomyces glabratus]KAI8387207.1 SH3 domain [Nakaseomyces glabratus]KAI8397702.1 SH3 domain [Nakaseomyces glabratus]KAJ9570183.1 Transmembrane osmosensor [Nakaseomyces glabratus]
MSGRRGKIINPRTRGAVRNVGFRNLISDPFAISSILIGLISWVITLGGCISVQVNEDFPRFTWWGIAFQFLIILMLIGFYIYDLVDYYRNFLTASIGVAFVYSTNSANYLIYGSGNQKAAASAGVVLLSMVNLIWIFYYGGDNASPINRWVDSFSLNGIRPSPFEAAKIKAYRRSSKQTQFRGSSVKLTHSTNNLHSASENLGLDNGFYNNPHTSNYVSSTALAEFENTGPPYPSASDLPTNNNAPLRSPQLGNNTIGDTYITATTNNNTNTTMGDTMGLYADLADESFPYRVKALYSYEADSADAYEMSFEQGEILMVSDIEGRWWKAKKESGETGIIPSNYVTIIDNDTEA